MKWELQEQRSTLLHFRKLAEEDERRAKEFVEVEQALKVKIIYNWRYVMGKNEILLCIFVDGGCGTNTGGVLSWA